MYSLMPDFCHIHLNNWFIGQNKQSEGGFPLSFKQNNGYWTMDQLPVVKVTFKIHFQGDQNLTI